MLNAGKPRHKRKNLWDLFKWALGLGVLTVSKKVKKGRGERTEAVEEMELDEVGTSGKSKGKRRKEKPKKQSSERIKVKAPRFSSAPVNLTGSAKPLLKDKIDSDLSQRDTETDMTHSDSSDSEEHLETKKKHIRSHSDDDLESVSSSSSSSSSSEVEEHDTESDTQPTQPTSTQPTHDHKLGETIETIQKIRKKRKEWHDKDSEIPPDGPSTVPCLSIWRRLLCWCPPDKNVPYNLFKWIDRKMVYTIPYKPPQPIENTTDVEQGEKPKKPKRNVKLMAISRLLMLKYLIWQILKNPPIMGVIIGLIWSLSGVGTNEVFTKYFGFLGDVVTPGATFIIGLFAFTTAIFSMDLCWGLVLILLKHMGLPLLMVPIVLMLGIEGREARAAILIASMPVALSGFSLTTQYGIEKSKKLIAHTIVWGTVLMMPTILIWLAIMDGLDVWTYTNPTAKPLCPVTNTTTHTNTTRWFMDEADFQF